MRQGNRRTRAIKEMMSLRTRRRSGFVADSFRSSYGANQGVIDPGASRKVDRGVGSIDELTERSCSKPSKSEMRR